MTTHITRSGNTQRMRLVNAEEARAAGIADAETLLFALSHADSDDGDPTDTPESRIDESLGAIVGLALTNRDEEFCARLDGYFSIIGPVLYRAQALEAKCALLSAALNQADRVAQTSADEQRAIHAAIATCSQISAGRIIATHPDDDDALVTLCELQLAVRALEPKLTESEGGEL